MRGSRARVLGTVIGGLALLLATAGLGGCGGSSRASSKQPAGVAGPSEVRAEPVGMATPNPFAPPVGKDRSGITPPRAAASSAGAATYSASLPGLYGGTRNQRSCDAGKLISFLEVNPAKAAAWASTLGIQTSQIRSYVDGLTPVLLRTDTRVTNHGYAGGEATSIQSVLEAGTAVFVNRYGEPVVKCYCGNPLTPPELLTAPRYVGPLWTGFSVTNITIIQQSTTVINVFKLFDPTRGALFPLTPGIDGVPGPYLGTGSAPPARPTGARTPGPAPSTSVMEMPRASFDPNPGRQGDTFVLSAAGFAPETTLAVVLTRPDGVVEHYSITTGRSGSGSRAFSNTGNVVTGTYHATITNPRTGASTDASVDVLPASSSGPSSETNGSSSQPPPSPSTDTSGSTDTTAAPQGSTSTDTTPTTP